LRAGARALTILTTPLNVHLLRALENGPVPLNELRRSAGSPPQTTLRKHLRALSDAEILEGRHEPGFPGPAEYELLPAGHELLGVAALLEAWLLEAPGGPIQLGSPAAKSSTKALVDGWCSGIVRVLAAKPLALTEISRLINSLSYPSLERRLVAMRTAELLKPCCGEGRVRPYAVTEWLRRAIPPLVGAIRWERKNLPEQTPPVRRIDIEAAFLLALPLVDLPEAQSGLCRLAVGPPDGAMSHQAGVMVGVERGKITSCVTRLDSGADASALGSAAAWVRATLERDWDRLELSGRRRLALALGEGLRTALFSSLPDARLLQSKAL
jgi:DNA-binding HxlR family transcriptional regulator